MGNTLLDKMYDAKSEYEVAYVSVFGEDKIKENRAFTNNPVDEAKTEKAISNLEYKFRQLAEEHAMYGEYDNLDVTFALGIVYNREELDGDYKKKPTARPLMGIVDIQLDSSDSYLDRKHVKDSINNVYYGSIGFMELDDFISYVETQGLTYNGPESYAELLYDILGNKKVTATVTANLSKKRNKTLVKKEK